MEDVLVGVLFCFMLGCLVALVSVERAPTQQVPEMSSQELYRLWSNCGGFSKTGLSLSDIRSYEGRKAIQEYCVGSGGK